MFFGKKRLVLLLCLIGTIGLLSGCGKKGYDPQKDLENAESMFEAGNIAEAHTKYDEIIEKSPRTAEAYIGALKTSENGINYGAYNEYCNKLNDVFWGIEDYEERETMRQEYDSFFEFVISEAVANDEEWSQREISSDNGVWGKDDALSMFEDSITRLSDEKANEILSANKDYIIGKIDYAILNGEKFWRERLTDKITEISNDQELLSKVEEIKAHNEEYDKYQELFNDIQVAYSQKEYQKVADLVEDEKIKELDKKIGNAGCYYLALIGWSYGEPTGNGNMYVAYYTFDGCDCGQFYIGEMQDGKRVGRGDWIWCKNSTYGLYVENYKGNSKDNWVDDAPNGEFEEYFYTVYENGYVEEWNYTTNYVNGLVNGKWFFNYKDEDGGLHRVEYECKNGRPVPEEMDESFAKTFEEQYGFTTEKGYFFALDYYTKDGLKYVRYNILYYGDKYYETGMSHYRKSFTESLN